MNSNFIAYWLATFLSTIGSFITMVIFPWLILATCGNDPIVMSVTLAAGSLPNLFFIAFGGVLADIYGPMRVIILSRLVFVVAMPIFATLVILGYSSVYLIVFASFSFGVLAASSMPAHQSILPLILPGDKLHLGNSIIMSSLQVAQFIGPVLAGALILLFKYQQGIPANEDDVTSIALALYSEFILICFTLIIYLRVKIKSTSGETRPKSMVLFLSEGISYCWRDRAIRVALAYVSLVSIFIHGPLAVALPLIVKVELNLSELVYGFIFGSTGLGILVGAFLGTRFKIPALRIGETILICDAFTGLALLVFSQSNHFLLYAALMFLIGVSSGIVMITGLTWFQKRAPGYLMGRVMSLLTAATIGLLPLSTLISGYVVSFASTNQLIMWSAMFILIISSLGLIFPSVRTIGRIPAIHA